MSALHDGPASPLFRPLAYEGNADLAAPGRRWRAGCRAWHDGGDGVPLALAPAGSCTAWGIPFVIGRPVLLADRPVVVDIPLLTAPWLVFMHTSDMRPLTPRDGGIITPMRGAGQLSERAADYVIRYEDGSEARATLRRRHELGAFRRRWGENCFAAVAHHKPYPLSAHHEAPLASEKQWGWRATRVVPADDSAWVNWLWAWENPQPEKAICGFRFEPSSGVVIVSAVSAGNVASSPLRWRPRRKARLVLPEGEIFNAVVDENGLLARVQIDLGQVISATPRLIYPTDAWADGYNNQVPDCSATEILLEYTCHPQAHLHLSDGPGSEGGRARDGGLARRAHPGRRGGSRFGGADPTRGAGRKDGYGAGDRGGQRHARAGQAAHPWRRGRVPLTGRPTPHPQPGLLPGLQPRLLARRGLGPARAHPRFQLHPG